jgi:rhodanese-related sulfurtransferase
MPITGGGHWSLDSRETMPGAEPVRVRGKFVPQPPVTPDELSPAELRDRLRSDRFRLIDVREPWEAAIASIDGSELVPLGTLGHSIEHIERDEPIVLYCHHGVRSARALAFLREHGFTRATHLAGGIEAYAAQIDGSLARY